MPIYEYQCLRCSERLETMQRWSDPPPAECPKCGGELKKLVSAPAFQFKGTGWYVTDYAKTGAGGEGDKASDRSSDGGNSDGGKDAGGAETTGRPSGETPSSSPGSSSTAASTSSSSATSTKATGSPKD